MSEDIYLGHDSTTESLSAQLPEYMPKDTDGGNYQLLSTVAERFDALDADILQVDRAATVQHADTVDQLRKLARLVDLRPYENESREHFRARVIAEYQLVTCEATVQDLLNGTKTILGANIHNIDYTEEHTTGGGDCQLSVPGQRLDNLNLSESEFARIAEQLIPSSYRLDLVRKGTFTYITPTMYSNDNHDADKGYDGLDTNDDPNGNGGTYAGLVD